MFFPSRLGWANRDWLLFLPVPDWAWLPNPTQLGRHPTRSWVVPATRNPRHSNLEFYAPQHPHIPTPTIISGHATVIKSEILYIYLAQTCHSCFLWQGSTVKTTFSLAPAEPPGLTPCCTRPQDRGDTAQANAQKAHSHKIRWFTLKPIGRMEGSVFARGYARHHMRHRRLLIETTGGLHYSQKAAWRVACSRKVTHATTCDGNGFSSTSEGGTSLVVECVSAHAYTREPGNHEHRPQMVPHMCRMSTPVAFIVAWRYIEDHCS